MYPSQLQLRIIFLSQGYKDWCLIHLANTTVTSLFNTIITYNSLAINILLTIYNTQHTHLFKILKDFININKITVS